METINKANHKQKVKTWNNGTRKKKTRKLQEKKKQDGNRKRGETDR